MLAACRTRFQLTQVSLTCMNGVLLYQSPNALPFPSTRPCLGMFPVCWCKIIEQRPVFSWNYVGNLILERKYYWSESITYPNSLCIYSYVNVYKHSLLRLPSVVFKVVKWLWKAQVFKSQVENKQFFDGMRSRRRGSHILVAFAAVSREVLWFSVERIFLGKVQFWCLLFPHSVIH